MNGESHRVYWQQWANNVATTKDSGSPTTANRSRRDLITSSAAVRITPEAKADDVTKLLRESSSVRSALLASQAEEEANSAAVKQSQDDDSIVLVGTLFNLPPNFIKYEHEQRLAKHEEEQSLRAASQGHVSPNNAQTITIQEYQSASPTKLRRRPTVSSSQPVHVIRTLRPRENPNAIRKLMVERLRSLQCQPVESTESALGDQKRPSYEQAAVSPKLQFFYLHPLMHNPILDLDGYMTSLEDDDEDDSVDEAADEDEEEVVQGDCEVLLARRFPWLSPQPSALKDALNGNAHQEGAVVDDRCSLVDVHQRRRDESFRQCYYLRQTASPSTCLSGYLLKRSPEDPNVWRRVHCVLTEDRLWFVSRIYEGADDSLVHARYRCIRLSRALLIVGTSEPSASTRVSLHATSHPASAFCFEVVSASGVSHFFRAMSHRVLQSWIAGLQARITQSGEKSFMEHAALIMVDESLARSKRTTSHGVLPLWKAVQDRYSDISGGSVDEGFATTGLGRAGALGKVLRWGLEVSNFQETCRYLHSRLPAKSPVVAVNPQPQSTNAPLDGKGSSHTSVSSLTEPSAADGSMNGEPLDPSLAQMIQDTWGMAHALLARAATVGREIRRKDDKVPSTSANPSHHRDPAPLSSVDTHCRHVEFILTGKFRPLTKEVDTYVTNGGGPKIVDARSVPKIVDARSIDTPRAQEKRETTGGPRHLLLSPPPVDLFDDLLRDLQEHAASAAMESMTSPSRIPTNDGAGQEQA